MNETLKTIASRYSCRAFSHRMPSDIRLNAIADAALASPSAVNRQPWRVIVVKNRDLIDEMENEALQTIASYEDKTMYERVQRRGGKIFYSAPCMIIVPCDSSDYAQMDCGILSQNVALAAESLGLASVICGMARLAFAGAKSEYFMERLGFPEGYTFGIAILLGHAISPVKPHEPDRSKLTFIM